MQWRDRIAALPGQQRPSSLEVRMASFPSIIDHEGGSVVQSHDAHSLVGEPSQFGDSSW